MIATYALAAGLGFVAGLRSMTAPAVTSWAAHVGWLPLQGTPLQAMGSLPVAVVLTLLALGEDVADLLPQTPRRTVLPSLAVRALSGALCGACACASAGAAWPAGAALGAAGAVAGAFAGYEARRRLVQRLRVKDALVAIPEDVLALGLASALIALLA